MSGMTLEAVGKSFGPVTAVHDVHLQFPPGKFVCLLGPSGCGKTTLLRLIAGLERPDSGRIVLDGTDITGVPAHKRNFGMVFQSHALFPHLTVGDNVAYGLRIRRVSRAEQRARVEELLSLVRLPGVAERHVSQLSGGQRQRVAMARALALQPALFLLDEPLSALDAKLREEMQVELRQIQERLGITTILVTHDQREAMTMADTIVVMEQGRVEQVGPPLEIYRSPANRFVASFIGTTNLLEGEVTGEGTVQVGRHPVQVDGARPLPGLGRKVTLSIRPEEVHLRGAEAAGPNRRPGCVTFVRDVGVSVETYVDCEGLPLVAVAPRRDRAPAAVGEAVSVELPAEACVVVEA